MKDHEKRELVNELTKIAKLYSTHQSLRDKISGAIHKALGENKNCKIEQTKGSNHE